MNYSWPFFDEEQINKVTEVIASGKVNYWTGHEGKFFEKEFASWCGTKYAVAVSNGSVALSLALHALGIKRGDEVIVPPRTFVATASCASLLGAKPIFAEICPNSGLINAQTIRPLITKKTKAISVVHLAGWPADMKDILELAKEIEGNSERNNILKTLLFPTDMGENFKFMFLSDFIIKDFKSSFKDYRHKL